MYYIQHSCLLSYVKVNLYHSEAFFRDRTTHSFMNTKLMLNKVTVLSNKVV